MSRRLNDLATPFRSIAFELLARFTEAGLSVLIVQTRRTDAEQAAAIAKGVSWVPRSKHQDGLAIDVCPYAIWQLHDDDKLQWDGSDPAWQTMGAIGESLGLRWGGRWQQRDLGHFEYLPQAPGVAHV